MKHKRLITLSIVLLVAIFSATVLAGGHGHKKAKKIGILLVAFGSSIPEAQVSFQNIDKKVKAA